MSVTYTRGYCRDDRFVGSGGGGVGGGTVTDWWRIVDSDGDTIVRTALSESGDEDRVDIVTNGGLRAVVDNDVFRIGSNRVLFNPSDPLYNPIWDDTYEARFYGLFQTRRDTGVSAGVHVIASFYRKDPGYYNAGFGVFYVADGSNPTYTVLYGPGGIDFAITTYKGYNWDDVPTLYLKDYPSMYGSKVGVNTLSPVAGLDVVHDVSISGYSMGRFYAKNNRRGFLVLETEAPLLWNNSIVGIKYRFGGVDVAELGFNSGNTTIDESFYVKKSSYGNTPIMIWGNGGVGITTNRLYNYKLYINNNDGMNNVGIDINGIRRFEIDDRGLVGLNKGTNTIIAGLDIATSFAREFNESSVAMSLSEISYSCIYIDNPVEDMFIDLPDATIYNGMRFEVKISNNYDLTYRIYFRSVVGGQIENGQDEWDISIIGGHYEAVSNGRYWMIIEI